MSEVLKTITGVYTKKHLSIKSLFRKIALLPKHETYYIGATANLNTRWARYSAWKFKHLLYKTKSFSIAKKAEEDLIRYASTQLPLCNNDPESRGLREGEKMYYVYILADKECQPR